MKEKNLHHIKCLYNDAFSINTIIKVMFKKGKIQKIVISGQQYE